MASKLPIRTRLIELGGQEHTVEQSVRCPARRCDMTLAQCADCEHWEALHLDDKDEEGSYLACRPPGHEAVELGVASQQAYEVGRAFGPMLDQCKVTEVMSKHVVCVAAEVNLPDLAAILEARRFGGLPVVNEQGVLVGFVSRRDLDRAGDKIGQTVASVMTTPPRKLTEHASVGQAAALMAFERVHQLPIVGDTDRVVGIVSALDIARWVGEQTGYVLPPIKERPRPKAPPRADGDER